MPPDAFWAVVNQAEVWAEDVPRNLGGLSRVILETWKASLEEELQNPTMKRPHQCRGNKIQALGKASHNSCLYQPQWEIFLTST